MTAAAVVGVDIARRSDYAAAVHLLPDTDGHRWRVALAEQIPHSADYARLVAYIAHLADGGRVVAVDATGVGAPVLEYARAATSHPVWGVTVHGGRRARQTGRWDLSLPKQGLVAYARRGLEDGRMVIPRRAPGADLLVSQLAQIAPVRRRGRRPALEARTGHDDVAFAWMVSVWMTRQR